MADIGTKYRYQCKENTKYNLKTEYEKEQSNSRRENKQNTQKPRFWVSLGKVCGFGIPRSSWVFFIFWVFCVIFLGIWVLGTQLCRK